MKARFFILTVFALSTCLFAAASDAPPGVETASKADLLGGVYHSETKKPLSNVSVTAYLSSKKEKVVMTDADGNYNFSDLKPGTYKFVFEKDGYKKVTREKVVIREDEGSQINVAMMEHATYDFMPGPSQFTGFDD